jgi:pyruvate/2-oxoglutarate dehydrogenase complex dihydrolipoamide dehydrogenase (E3) component
LTIGETVGVELKKVKARKDAVSGNSRTGLETWLKRLANCTVYEGRARFETLHDDVRVGEELPSADRIFLNVGGRALVPDMAGLDKVDYLTNTSMLDLDVAPRHLVIVGGGNVALAQMYRRFGSEVTVVEKGPRLIQREDEEVSGAVQGILEAEGVRIRLRAECISFAQLGADIAVRVDCESGNREVVGSHVLLAVGRRPNTDDLGLDRAGIETDKLGYIMVDDQLRTSVPGVWALGDCNGKGAFTHTSYNDFEIVAANLLDGDRRRICDRLPAYALYVDPPLGRAGMTEAETRHFGKRILVGTRPMTRVARAIEKGETQGFIKIVVDADTQEILGAAILGVGGDEAIHGILDIMYAKVPYTTLQRAVHIHPTVAELIPTILVELKPRP